MPTLAPRPRHAAILLIGLAISLPGMGAVALTGGTAPSSAAAPGSVAEPRLSPEDATLAARARAILEADYRGERDELARLEREMRGAPTGRPAHHAYWQGFALWRRALNGFNETPFPADLKPDLEAALACFRASHAADTMFVDADIAMVGCLSNLVYLAGADSAVMAGLLREYGPVGRRLRARGMENPRGLWILGGLQAFAPPPAGGNLAKALELYHRGLGAARREALAGTKPWEPAWGAPELLMSLAYLHSQGSLANRTLARAYAEGALAAVPQWHYVREILLPQIEAMPETTSAK